jgi:hypothetical protein
MLSGVAFVHIILRAVVFSAVFFGLGFALWFIINSFFPELLYPTEETASSQTDEQGGHISIAMDSAGEYAVPELFNKPGDSEELGNIEDLISGVFKRRSSGDNIPDESNQSAYPGLDFSVSSDEGVDRNKEEGYNDLGAVQDVKFSGSAASEPDDIFETPIYEKTEAEKSAAFQPQFTPSFGDDSGLGGLPDLDMMAMAFSNYSGAPAPAPSTAAYSASSAPVIHPVEEYEPDRSQYKGNKPQTLQGDFNPKSLAEGIRTVLSKG